MIAIVGIVVLGVLALGATIAWAVRDVARHRIDVDARREQGRSNTNAFEARVDELEERLVRVERIAAGVERRPVRK